MKASGSKVPADLGVELGTPGSGQIVWIQPAETGMEPLAFDLLERIAKSNPSSRMIAVVPEGVAGLYVACPYLGRLITFDPIKIKDDKSYKHAFHASLATYELELAVDVFHPDLESGKRLIHATKATHKVAFSLAPDPELSFSVIPGGPFEGEQERLMQIIDHFGLTPEAIEPKIWLELVDIEKAKQAFDQLGLKGKTLAYFPTGIKNEIEHSKLASAIGKVANANNVSTIVIMPSCINEKPMAVDFSGYRGNIIDLRDVIEPRFSVVLLSYCYAAAGNEHRWVHWATAINKPHMLPLCGGGFGRHLPYSKETTVALLPLTCYGCNWSCPFDRVHCIQNITESTLIRALEVGLHQSPDRIRLVIENEEQASIEEAPYLDLTPFVDPLLTEIVELYNSETHNNTYGMTVQKNASEIKEARKTLNRRGLDFIEDPNLNHLKLGMQVPHLGDAVKSWDVLRTIEFIESTLSKESRVLDIGAYCSEIPCILHQLNYPNLAGIDLNPGLAGMPFQESIDYKIANFHYTDFEDSTFDAITAISVIEHGFDRPRLLKELSRILKPGGWFIASVDYWQEKIDTTDKTFWDMSWIIFSEDELKSFFKEAERYGLKVCGFTDFMTEASPIDWNDRKYTFAWFALQKAPHGNNKVAIAEANPSRSETISKIAHSHQSIASVQSNTEIKQGVASKKACIAILSTFNQPCGIATHTSYLINGIKSAAEELKKELEILVLAEERDNSFGNDPDWVLRCWSRKSNNFDRALQIMLDRKVSILHVQFQAGLYLYADLPAFLKACRDRGIRIFGTFHSMENNLELASRSANLMEGAFVHLEQGRIRLIAHGTHPDRLKVVPHGVCTTESFCGAKEPRQTIGLPQGCRLITSFGFLEPHKGVAEIIQALPRILERHPDVQFIFLGGGHPDNPESGRYIQYCKLVAKSLNVENLVHFIDRYLSDDDAGNIISASDVVVMNYSLMRNEVSGAASFALAQGRPMVTAPTPAFLPLVECTLQTSVDMDLSTAINLILSNTELSSYLERQAKRFSEEHSFSKLGSILLKEYGLTNDESDANNQSLSEIFHTSLERPSTKWSHYFTIYETHLSPFRRMPINLLEIGINKGGSLGLWKQYFSSARIFALDIEPSCKTFEEPGISIYTGDQTDPPLLEKIAFEAGGFDVVIDDGGHRMNQQIDSFNLLFPHLRDGGIYIIEDMHTSYMEEYGGGLLTKGSAIEYFKSLVDGLTWWSQRQTPEWIDEHLESVHFYDSVCVLVKKKHPRPEPLTRP